jgi:DNA-binding GntR family transcriptional regulator
MIALEHEGLVTIEHHRGAFINRIDAETIRDQYDLLTLLWRWAIERSVAKATADQRADMAIVAAKIHKTRDPDEMLNLMTLFVNQVEQAGGSAAWRRLVNALPRLVPAVAYYRVVPGAMTAVSKWIVPVAAGIQSRDVKKSASAMSQLMHGQGEALIAELDRRHVFDVPA